MVTFGNQPHCIGQATALLISHEKHTIMKKEHSITQLIIDESGSMSTAREFVHQTYRSIINAMKNERVEFPELQQYIEIWTFSGVGTEVRCVLPFQKIEDTNVLLDLAYEPNGGTPLYDAMGRALINLETKLMHENQYDDPDVSIMILTDGMENASHIFNGTQIQEIVQRLQQQKWKFTYFGTDHDVHDMAARISIQNSYAFQKNREGFNRASRQYIREREENKLEYLIMKGIRKK